MENLVSRNTYDSDETGYWRRLRLVMGLAFGISMGVVFAAIVPDVEMTPRIVIGFVSGTLAGVLFGSSYPRTLRRKMSSFTDALFAGSPEIVVEPPAEKEMRYRLPCSWMKSASFAVGGVLYIGRDGLLFVPHRKNLEHDRATFEMGSPNQIRLSLVPPPPLGLVQRILVPHPSKQLEVRSNGRLDRFLIPEPERVVEIIGRRIQELAAAPPY